MNRTESGPWKVHTRIWAAVVACFAWGHLLGCGPTEKAEATSIRFNVERSGAIVCLTLSTGNSQCGDSDILFAPGHNVDLLLDSPDRSGIESRGGYCLLAGHYEMLHSVPADYRDCVWEPFIDGTAGLAKRGLIVRDRLAQRHYRVRVQSNDMPTIALDYNRID